MKDYYFVNGYPMWEVSVSRHVWWCCGVETLSIKVSFVTFGVESVDVRVKQRHLVWRRNLC